MTIPESHQDLLADETRAIAFLATVMDDATPQVTPVWFDVEGDLIRINSALGRVKDRNIRARPQIALTIVDPQDVYRYLQLRGTVVKISEEGARDHIDTLARKYTNNDAYPWYKGETRVLYYLKPDSVDAH